ncbi:MAG: transglutaminase-like domain-containing protein, partial [Limisphaerales bacterium]
MASPLLKVAAMKFFGKCFFAALLLTGLLFVTSAQALTVEQIRSMPNLTPEKFASLFSDFKFKFHEEVQDFQTFLSSKSGDCDDYATLAADVLSKHGYTPRLIAVRMKGETHVVCYIEETGSYLDYNNRKDAQKLVKCGNEITTIA